MLLNKDYKFWFCTGSQDLYGDECLAKVAQHSKQIVDELNKTGVLPYEIVWGARLQGKLARAPAQKRMDIISGMAMGIDADAHSGALEEKRGYLCGTGGGGVGCVLSEKKPVFI